MKQVLTILNACRNTEGRLRTITLRFWVILICCFIFISHSLKAQGEQLNTLATDAYSTLRSIVSQTIIEPGESDTRLEYRLNEGQKFYVRYFIGANTFTLKSDIDILNRIIYAKIKFSAIVKPYDYDRTKIDSLYLLIDKDAEPFNKYLYYPQKDVYSKVIHQGKFTLVEVYNLVIRQGKTNPVLDSGTEEDRLVVKMVPYLYDTGRWYKIPNSKNQLIDFVRQHYKKSINKKSIESGSSINTLIKFN